jgi:hypothetical protein
MHTEVIELIGEGVGGVGSLLQEKLHEYQGVQDVRTEADERRLKLTVEYDDTAAGEFDDSALFILERDMGMKGVSAKFLVAPPWQLSAECRDAKHADCGSAVHSEYWQTTFECKCECH